MRSFHPPFVRPSAVRGIALAIAAALVTVHGRVLDATTGQALVSVGIDVYPGGKAAGKRLLHTSTDADGRFALRGLRSGTYTLSLSSDDVPRSDETIRVDAAHPRDLQLRACSTTLDYSCAPKFQAPGSDPGAGG